MVLVETRDDDEASPTRVIIVVIASELARGRPCLARARDDDECGERVARVGRWARFFYGCFNRTCGMYCMVYMYSLYEWRLCVRVYTHRSSHTFSRSRVSGQYFIVNTAI